MGRQSRKLCEKNCPNSYESYIGVMSPSPPVPSAPSELRLTSLSESNAVMSWNKPRSPYGPIDGYEVAVVLSSKKPQSWDYVETKDQEFRASNLLSAAKYTMYVVAFNLDDSFPQRSHTPQRLKSSIAIFIFTTCE